MLTLTATQSPIHIPGQCISREAQARSLSTYRTLQSVTLELGIVCIRVASFHTTRDITSVALGQCYNVGQVHSLVGLQRLSVVGRAGVQGQIHALIPEFLHGLIFNEVIMNPNVNLKFATLLLLIKMIDVKMDSDVWICVNLYSNYTKCCIYDMMYFSYA